MAEARLNPLFEMIQGAVGDLVFKRYGNRVVISKKPVFQNRKFSKAQKKNQERFREATAYGRTAFADPEIRGTYEKVARRTGKPILSLMIGDFLHPPTIDQLDLSEYDGNAGRRILIQASDDFEVAKVSVAIVDGAGSEVEQGAASNVSGTVWAYTSSVQVQAGETVTVEATAFDWPGHTSSTRKEHRIG